MDELFVLPCFPTRATETLTKTKLNTYDFFGLIITLSAHLCALSTVKKRVHMKTWSKLYKKHLRLHTTHTCSHDLSWHTQDTKTRKKTSWFANRNSAASSSFGFWGMGRFKNVVVLHAACIKQRRSLLRCVDVFPLLLAFRVCCTSTVWLNIYLLACPVSHKIRLWVGSSVKMFLMVHHKFS